MSHKVISLKYRPQHFDALTGQSHVVRSLKGAINSGAIGHALLFAGPRGVGKTTMARIFAKSVNCINGPTISPCQECQNCREITASRSIDVVEIDGASNRGIDEIRNLREGVKYAPLYARYKIYIIDEAHMLTTEAFNALLKTLEEPPANVIFILATTNPTKIPRTILSRCQRFVFKRLSISEISRRIQEVAEKEQINITKEAVYYLAQRADGSIRDGESILQQLASFTEKEITRDDVFKFIGFLGSDFYVNLLNSVTEKNLAQVIFAVNKGIEDGADPLEIYRGFVDYLRKILLLKIGITEELLELSLEEVEILKEVPITKDDAMMMLETCLKFEDVVKRSINPRIAIEILFGQLINNLQPIPKSGRPQIASEIQHTTSCITNSEELKNRLMALLEKRSPRLAGIIYRTEIKKDGQTINIEAENEFSKKELMNNHKILSEMLLQITGEECALAIKLLEAKKMARHKVIKTIKAIFDGEEVR